MKKSLETQCREAIDGSWRYSWHWPRNSLGLLGEEGWRKIMDDAQTSMHRAEQRIRDEVERIKTIRALLPEIEERISWYAEEVEETP